jgi:hypothetical protein
MRSALSIGSMRTLCCCAPAPVCPLHPPAPPTADPHVHLWMPSLHRGILYGTHRPRSMRTVRAPRARRSRMAHAWSVQLHQRPHRRRPRLHFRPPPPWPVRLATARAPILRLFDTKVGSTTRAHTHAPSLDRYVQTYIRHMHALPAWSTRTRARTHRHRSMWAPCVHLERGPVVSVPQTRDGE